MKKTVSVVIAAFVLILLFGFSALAGVQATVYIPENNVKPGDTFSVPVMLDLTPGINTLRLFLDYDRESFELIECKDGGILGAATHSKELSADPFVLYWTNGSKGDYSENGVLATLSFKVKHTAKSGNYKLDLYFNSQNDCVNTKLEPILIRLVDGSVNVQTDSVSVSSDLQNISSVTQSKIPTTSTSSEVSLSSNQPEQTSSSQNVSSDLSSVESTQSSNVSTEDNKPMINTVIILVSIFSSAFMTVFAVVKLWKKRK